MMELHLFSKIENRYCFFGTKVWFCVHTMIILAPLSLRADKTSNLHHANHNQFQQNHHPHDHHRHCHYNHRPHHHEHDHRHQA